VRICKRSDRKKTVCIDIALDIKSPKKIAVKKENQFFIHVVQHFFGAPPTTVFLTPIRVPPVDACALLG
jgi:hypothetical protein